MTRPVVGCVVGRFQVDELHTGHVALLLAAAAASTIPGRLVVLLGEPAPEDTDRAAELGAWRHEYHDEHYVLVGDRYEPRPGGRFAR